MENLTSADYPASAELPNNFEKYTKYVDGWAVYGYHPDLCINGVDYRAMKAYFADGKDKLLLETNGDQVAAMRDVASAIVQNWQFGRDGFKNPTQNMLVSFVDLSESVTKTHPQWVNHKVALITFFHDNHVSQSGRGGDKESVSLVAITLPSELADELENSIQDAPDLVNEILINSLSGIDSTGLGKGYERYKATGIINIKANQLQDVAQGKTDPFKRDQLRSLVGQNKPLDFKKGPYGYKDYSK